MDEDKEEKEKLLRVAFFDIYKGCSKIELSPPEDSALFNPESPKIFAWAKHFSFFDQIELDREYQKSFDKAKESGLSTRQEMLEMLEKTGAWTTKEETDWASKKQYVQTLEQTKSKLVVPSQIKSLQNQIDKARKDVNEVEAKRSSLIGQTCENYANSQLNSQTILYSLFEDQECKKPLISGEDIEYIDNRDLSLLISAYNKGVAPLDINSIKKMSLSGFFTSYFSLVEKNPIYIFNVKNICELTFYQLNLLSYAKVLRSIIRNTDPPKHLMDNPDKLLEWSEKGEKARKMMEKSQDGEKAFSVVGANKDDYKEMGTERKGKSIFDLASQGDKGGELGIMDFINE